MLSNYNYLTIAFLFCTVAVAARAAFVLAELLYKAPNKSHHTLHIVFSLIMGSSLGAVHLLAVYATLSQFKPSYSPNMLVITLLCSVGIAYSVFGASASRELTFKALVKSVLICTPLLFIMFFADWGSNLAFNSFHTHTPELILAIFVSMLALASDVLIFSWVKNYQGEYQQAIKMALAGAIALGIFSVHLAYNQAIHPNVSYAEHNTSYLNGLAIALVLIVLLAVFFAGILFYERTVSKRLLGRMQSGDIPLSEIPLDALTQLPNRKAFDLYLESAPNRRQHTNHSFAVAYIDLDHFKPINDQLGHHVGDAVLNVMARRLDAAVRSCDFVARIGGDEFAVLFEQIASDEDIIPIAQRIIDAVKEPFWTLKHPIEISCSIGIAVYTPEMSLKTLVQNADAAMYKAKQDGKNQFKFFDKQIEIASNQLQDMNAELQAALDERQFSLVYLPRVDCKSFSPIGAEALIRWHHPQRGLLLPKQFMPAAERFGYINQINDWVLAECCRTLAQANKTNIDLRLSANLSAQQFRNVNLLEKITKLLQQHSLRPDQLILELKDMASVPNQKQMTNMLKAFKQAGIKVSLDDFGAQFFSIDFLQAIDIAEVKLEKSFIQQIDVDIKIRNTLDAVIRLAHALGLNVVASGVENKAQRHILKELNCNQMQGFSLAQPLTQKQLMLTFGQLYDKYELTGQFSIDDYQAISN